MEDSIFLRQRLGLAFSLLERTHGKMLECALLVPPVNQGGELCDLWLHSLFFMP